MVQSGKITVNSVIFIAKIIRGQFKYVIFINLIGNRTQLLRSEKIFLILTAPIQLVIAYLDAPYIIYYFFFVNLMRRFHMKQNFNADVSQFFPS